MIVHYSEGPFDATGRQRVPFAYPSEQRGPFDSTNIFDSA